MRKQRVTIKTLFLLVTILVLLNAITGWMPPHRYLILEGSAQLVQAAPAEAAVTVPEVVDTTPKPLPPVPNTNRPTQRQIVDYIERIAREKGGDDRFALFAKALAYSESKIKQFDENGNPLRRVNGEANPTVDVGTFQINNFWHKDDVDSNRAGTDWKYNVEQGVRIAKESWDRAGGNAFQAALNYKGQGKNAAAQQVVNYMSTVINGDDGKPLWQVRVNRYQYPPTQNNQFSINWPLDHVQFCGGEFGVPTSFQPQGHTGLDLCGIPTGTPIKASEAGIVAYAGEWPQGWAPESGRGHGWTVWIFHGTVEGQNLFTSYGHASKLLVKKGDTIEKGQTIALVGSTGASSGPHVHFEVRVGGGAQYQGNDDFGNWSAGRYQNPRNWVRSTRSITQAPPSNQQPPVISPGQTITPPTLQPTNPITATGTFTLTLRGTWAVDFALWLRDRHKDIRTQTEFLEDIVKKKKELDQAIPLPGMGIEQVEGMTKALREQMKTLEDIERPVAFIAIAGQPIAPINPNGVTLDPWILYGVLMDPPMIALTPLGTQPAAATPGTTPIIPEPTGPRIDTLPDVQAPQLNITVTGLNSDKLNKFELQRWITTYKIPSLEIQIKDDQRCFDPRNNEIALGCMIDDHPTPLLIVSPRSFNIQNGRQGSFNFVLTHELWHIVQRWAPDDVIRKYNAVRIEPRVGLTNPQLLDRAEGDAKMRELELAPQFSFIK